MRHSRLRGTGVVSTWGLSTPVLILAIGRVVVGVPHLGGIPAAGGIRRAPIRRRGPAAPAPERPPKCRVREVHGTQLRRRVVLKTSATVDASYVVAAFMLTGTADVMNTLDPELHVDVDVDLDALISQTVTFSSSGVFSGENVGWLEGGQAATCSVLSFPEKVIDRATFLAACLGIVLSHRKRVPNLN